MNRARGKAGASRLPGRWTGLAERWPSVAAAYESLSEACRHSGPLTAEEVAIVKLAVSVGRGASRTVHSHARKALRAGCDPEALRHVVRVALPTVGLPAMLDALKWIDETIEESDAAPRRAGARRA